MNEKIPNIFDVYDEEGYPLELTKMESLLGKELILREIKETTTQLSDKAWNLMLEYKNELHKVLTSSQILMDQILPVAHRIPFTVKIVKEGRYYTLAK